MSQKINEIINVPSIAQSLGTPQHVERSLQLWQQIHLTQIYSTLLDYYKNLGDKLFSYPGPTGPIPMPLYVKPVWQELTRARLNMTLQNNTRTYQPSEMQLQFWNFYNQMKNLKPDVVDQLYDGKIFRLMNFIESDQSLALNFEIGQFSHAVMCQYLLEHELIMALANNVHPSRDSLAIRNQVAEDEKTIAAFFQHNIARIGINNLILVKRNSNTYLAIARKKSMQSMIQHHLFDQISSCIFEMIDSLKVDFDLQNTVLRETCEELFGQPDQATNPNEGINAINNQEMVELQRMLQNGSAVFQVTGFCIDLVRLVPEITTLLIIHDRTFFKHFLDRNTHLNDEFLPGSFFQIPSNLDDVDAFLKSAIVSDPDGNPHAKGFDPMLWTLPGGFSFYQGLKRAVGMKLLN